MTPAEIQQEIEERGLSHAAIGRRARPRPLSHTTIWKNVQQIPGNKSARARRLIAKAIDRTVEEVFGPETKGRRRSA
jgi:hypothetical protein